MGCGSSSQKKLMRQVSKGEKVEDAVVRNAEAAKQARRAAGAVSEDFDVFAAAAEKSIDALIGTAEEVPVLGSVFKLLGKCWKAAKSIKKTERGVEKLMRTADRLAKFLKKARRASTFSDEDVEPLVGALQAVEEFLTQRTEAGTVFNALTHEMAAEKVTELDKDLQTAMNEFIGLANVAHVEMTKARSR